MPPASLPGSTGIGLPQYGHSPDVMPTLAATGCPQLGQVPIWTWGSLPATALGLKHMINLRSIRGARAPRRLRRPSAGLSCGAAGRRVFHIATR